MVCLFKCYVILVILLDFFLIKISRSLIEGNSLPLIMLLGIEPRDENEPNRTEAEFAFGEKKMRTELEQSSGSEKKKMLTEIFQKFGSQKLKFGSQFSRTRSQSSQIWSNEEMYLRRRIVKIEANKKSLEIEVKNLSIRLEEVEANAIVGGKRIISIPRISKYHLYPRN
uniref:Paramyosin, short form n=2 Tax=Cacopsylla melanoneura TaxID=428564 RepID=A0A8D9EI25_9HEMI